MKLTEFLFEKFETPNIFLCKDSVLAAFSCGRSTAVVLDSGATSTRITPVHDGYALQRSLLKAQIGGNTITEKLLEWLTKSQNVEVNPRYSFKRTFSNKDGQETYTTVPVEVKDVDPTFHRYHQLQIVKDLKEEYLYVAEEPLEGLGAS